MALQGGRGGRGYGYDYYDEDPSQHPPQGGRPWDRGGGGAGYGAGGPGSGPGPAGDYPPGNPDDRLYPHQVRERARGSNQRNWGNS